MSERRTLFVGALSVLLAFLPCGAGFAASTSRNAASPQLSRESFQFRISLEGKAGAVLALPLPAAVYSRLLRPDGKDICVFDRNGSPVPFTLREKAPTAPPEFSHSAAIPFFPWRPDAEQSAPPLRSDVEIDLNGGIVRVRRQEAAEGASGLGSGGRAGPAALLLDLGSALNPASRPEGLSQGDRRKFILSLVPEDSSASFVTRVTARASADLARWHSLGPPKVLARLIQGSSRVESLEILLPADCERYILLEGDGVFPKAREFTATSVYVRRGGRNADPGEEETALEGLMSADKRSVLYDAGFFPLTRVSCAPPRPEIMPVRLEAGSSPRGPWSLVASGTVYRMEKDGAELIGDTFSMPGRLPRQRYWRLTAASDIPFAVAPALRLHWAPHTLLFFSRGEGPWELAVGREAAVAIPDLPMDILEGSTEPEPALASLNSAPDSHSRPQTRSPGAGMDQWALWLALALGVAVLSLLAFYLMRSMNKG